MAQPAWHWSAPAAAPLPYSGPPRVPRRPRLGRALLYGFLVVLFVAGALLVTSVVGTQTGAAGLVAGVLLASLPVFPVAATLVWLDRYESEPRGILLFAFGWGAVVASLGALVLNTASIAAIRQAGGNPTSAAIFVAPVVEEALKGCGVLVIMLARRREFDGVVDGIVYGGFVGLGFAFCENVLYLGTAFSQQGGTAAVITFVLRGVLGPFAHPLFTACTGIGLGIAVRTRSPTLKLLAPLAGWVVAIALHGLWNLTASVGLRGFISGYLLVQVPVFLTFVVIAVLARRHEGTLIGRELAGYARAGWLSPGEVTMLASIPARRAARRWAGQARGGAGARAMRDFQELGSELAFLRTRMDAGTAPVDAARVEHAMLASMYELRRRFLPATSGYYRG